MKSLHYLLLKSTILCLLGILLTSYGVTAQQIPAEDVLLFSIAEADERYCATMTASGNDVRIIASIPSVECSSLFSPNGLVTTSLQSRTISELGRALTPEERSNLPDTYILTMLDPNNQQVSDVFSIEDNYIQYAYLLPGGTHALAVLEAFTRDSTGWYDSSGNKNVVRIDLADGSYETLLSFVQNEVWLIYRTLENGSLSLAVSPNGEQLLLIRNENMYGRGELASLATDGSGIVSLVEDGVYICTSWSPDGTMIAFSHLSIPSRTVTVNAQSANARSGPGQNYGVVNTFSMGTELEILENRQGWLKVLNAEGQEVWISNTLVTGNVTGMPVETVEVIHADGTGQRTLAIGSDPVWSPDGSRIAYNGADGIYVVTLEGEQVARIQIGNAGYARWSPDGKQIAYFTSSNRINRLHVLDLETGVNHFLHEAEVNYNSACGSNSSDQIRWSPSGTRLLFDVCDYNPSTPSICERLTYLCDLQSCEPINTLSDQFGDEARIFFASWYLGER